MSPPVLDSPPSGAEGVASTSLAARLTILSVASSMLMQSIDSTVLSTALPTLARVFNTNPINLKLCLTSYIMALAVFVPASAWAADRFGARRVFFIALGVFVLGSMLCGLSHSLEQLVAARILQGAGGAMMTPVARVIVIGTHRREDLLKAMVWLGTPAIIGPILGPPLSGLILSIADWPWIFYINLPIGLLGMAAVLRFVPPTRTVHPGRFDTLGFALAATAICSSMFGAETLGLNLAPAWVQVLAWTIAAGAAIAYVRHAHRHAKPVLNLRLLKVPALQMNQTGGTLMRLTQGATPFLLPLLLQGGLGWTPLAAGGITVAIAVGSVTARVGAQSLVRRFGFRFMLITTALLGGASMILTGFFRSGTPLVAMGAVLALGGFVRANHLTSINALAFSEIPEKDVSQASSLTSVVQQLAQALGITVAGITLHLSQVITAPHGVAPLAPANFILPFCVVGLGTMAAAFAYLPLPANAGAHLYGREGHRARR